MLMYRLSNDFGGVVGSNPSLLKRSACLFFGTTALTVLVNDPSILFLDFSKTTGGFMDKLYSIKAATLAILNSATYIATAVMAGLAANGLTPHLS